MYCTSAQPSPDGRRSPFSPGEKVRMRAFIAARPFTAPSCQNSMLQCTRKVRSEMKTVSKVCRKCGAEIFADAPEGVCSVCLFRTGLALLDAKDDEAFEPTVARMLKDFGDYELLQEIGRGGQ